MRNSEFHIAVLPGDGIGDEVMRPCLDLLEKAAARVGGLGFRFETLPAGAGHYRETGQSMPKETRETCSRADAILLAAMGLPEVRYPDGREIAPQIELRMDYGLYAGVRPVRPLPGVRPILADPRAADIDYVIVRESTEGLFAPQAPGEIIEDREARETLVLTRPTCEKLYDFCFRLAGQRAAQRGGGQPKVTHVDKANVFSAFHWARGIFHERAKGFPQVEADAVYVDAFAMHMVQKPWTIDVAVTENMFGDILTDEASVLAGSMGMLPSASIGEGGVGLYEPIHGSAPDIAGKGIANPLGMILSAALCLRHSLGLETEAAVIEKAASDAVTDGARTTDLGGSVSTVEMANQIIRRIEAD